VLEVGPFKVEASQGAPVQVASGKVGSWNQLDVIHGSAIVHAHADSCHASSKASIALIGPGGAPSAA